MTDFTLSGLPFPDGKNPLGFHPEVEGVLRVSARANAIALLSAASTLTGGANLTIGASNPPGGVEHLVGALGQFPTVGVVRASLALIASASILIQVRADLGGQLDAVLAGVNLYDLSPLPVHARAEFAGTLLFQPVVGSAASASRLIAATAPVSGFVSVAQIVAAVNGTDNVVAAASTLLPATDGVRVIGVLRSPPYLFFDGAATYVWHDNASDADLNGGSNFSCAVLLDPEVANLSQSGTVCGKHDPSGTQFGWEVRWDKTTGLVTVVVSTSLDGTNRVERLNATAIRTRSILVFTYDGTDIRIVLNGATDEGTQTPTGTPGAMVTTTAKFGIGARVNSATTGSNFYRGAVCGVWIWNVTLTLGEAQGITAQGVIPVPPQSSGLKVQWDPYAIGSNGINIFFHNWIDQVGSARQLQANALPRPIVFPVEASPTAVMAFSDLWGLDFLNFGSYGPDSNLTSDYPLNVSAIDASENGTYRRFNSPTNVIHPQITSGFRNFRSDITLFLRGRKNVASVSDITFFDFLGFRLFYDNVTRDLFLFVGSTGTPDRYDFGKLQQLRAGVPAVLCLRWNVVNQTVSLVIGNLKVEPDAITSTGSPASGTGLQLCDDADFKDARVIAACATDEMVENILNDLSGVFIESLELDSKWRAALQARPDLSLQFGSYVTDYQAEEEPDDVPFILQGATGTLALSGQPSDGDRFAVSDGGSTRTFEFESGGGVSGANIAVTIGGTVLVTLDNLIAAVNASALNITASPRVDTDLSGNGTPDAAWTRLNHDQVPVNPFSSQQNVAILIPVNASGNLSATGMARAFLFDEELIETFSNHDGISVDLRFRFVDEPYPVLEAEDFGDIGAGALPFDNPNPIIISVIADVAHNVTATANAGPTDAGPVEFWWEVEVETGSVETLIRIDMATGTFSLNRNEVDTWTVPDGFNFKNKRIRFVIRSLIDPEQSWASLFLRMEGDNFDNSATEVIIIPGAGAPEVPLAIDLLVSLEQQQFAIEEAAQAQRGQVRVSNRSRYKLTRAFFNSSRASRLEGRNQDGREFGLMSTLPDFEDLGINFQTHRVRSFEIGFPEQIAVRYYGVGFEDLWWAIAYTNRIIDPELDMFDGMELVIPNRDALTAFLSRKPEPLGR